MNNLIGVLNGLRLSEFEAESWTEKLNIWVDLIQADYTLRWKDSCWEIFPTLEMFLELNERQQMMKQIFLLN